jgi:tetratricopeptide (TPR) repeat protein
VLTTPSAEFVNQSSWSEQVLAALSPGYHAILFTATGLESLLRKSGFSDVRVVRREERLVAVAGKGRSVSKFNISRHPSGYYAKYLSKLIDSDVPEFLRCGAAFRLFEEHVNRGDEREASEAWRCLDRLLGQMYGACPSVLDPGRIAEFVKLANNFEEFGKQAPYCLSSILFLRGMQLLNWSGDFAEAARLFRSASEMIAIEIDKEQAWFIAPARLYWLSRLHQGIAELRGDRRLESLATLQSIVESAEVPASQRPCGDRAQLLPSIVSRALKEMGVAHLQLGNLESALALFRRALDRSEDTANQRLSSEVRSLIEVAIATYRTTVRQPRSLTQIRRSIRDRLREFDRWRRRLIRGR